MRGHAILEIEACFVPYHFLLTLKLRFILQDYRTLKNKPDMKIPEMHFKILESNDQVIVTALDLFRYIVWNIQAYFKTTSLFMIKGWWVIWYLKS